MPLSRRGPPSMSPAPLRFRPNGDSLQRMREWCLSLNLGNRNARQRKDLCRDIDIQCHSVGRIYGVRQLYEENSLRRTWADDARVSWCRSIIPRLEITIFSLKSNYNLLAEITVY